MSISGWVMSVTSAIAVGTLADIIIADGGTKKFVKGIAALIVFATNIYRKLTEAIWKGVRKYSPTAWKKRAWERP